MNPAAHFLVAVALWTAAPAAGAQQREATDPRIHTVAYDPGKVVHVRGYFGYQMMIEFAPGERIENVSIGDAMAWQITPNRRAERLFLKPLDIAVPTNMTVITDQRTYFFELSVRRAPARASDLAYAVRFTYPATAEAAPLPRPAPERRNVAYTYTGSRAILPSLVFDDGRFTYFQWPEDQSTPALFVIGEDGAESIANFSVRDGYTVIEQLAQRFVLRSGREVTTIHNVGWRNPVPGDSAPKPHDAQTARQAARGGS